MAVHGVGAEHEPLGGEGRKRSAGAALLSSGGDVLAIGEALLVEPRQAP